MANSTKEIHWNESFERALKEAEAQKRHVLLDFSAAPM